MTHAAKRGYKERQGNFGLPTDITMLVKVGKK